MKNMTVAFSLSSKFMLVTSIVLLLSLGSSVYLATDLYREDGIIKAQESNQQTSRLLADRIETDLKDLIGQMKTFAALWLIKKDQLDSSSLEAVLQQADDVLAVRLFQVENDRILQKFSLSNEPRVKDLKLSDSELSLEGQKYADQSWQQWKLGNRKATPPMNLSRVDASREFPVLRLSFFTQQTQLLQIDFSPEAFLKYFLKENEDATGTRHFLLDENGSILLSSDQKLRHAQTSTLPFVRSDLENKKELSRQSQYRSFDEQKVFGSFQKLTIVPASILSEVVESQAIALVKKFEYRAGLLFILSVSLSMVLVFYFAWSLTSPLTLLTQATQDIMNGKFHISLPKKTSDEIGLLSTAFGQMVQGLKERDRLKGVFSKFHSKEVADQILNGELKLGGEKKYATVFFSDIRGFTRISEQMPPEEVVQLLNVYMTEMVRIIHKWHGVVDKYIGDAIMAVWGVPKENPEDAYRAVRAALEMREYMLDWEKQATEAGATPLKIGIGLHSGEVVAGNIGSEERLEFTVIGDTVNQASRVEAGTKAAATDFLITAQTATSLTEAGIVIGPALQLQAKGKSEPLTVHQVIGYTDESGQLVTSLSEEQINLITGRRGALESEEEEKSQLFSA